MLPQIEMKAVDIESLLQYTFTDKRIAVEAVQMAAPQIACMHNNNFEGLDNNKRLSVLGNAVLAKVLCGAWFEARDPSGQARSQAQWTQLRNDMLSNDALAPRGYQAGLDELVIVADSRPAVSPKMVATSLEAIIGAVYHDGGDEAALRVMNSLGFFDHPLLTISAQLPLESAKRGNAKFSQRKVGALFYFPLRLGLQKGYLNAGRRPL